MNVNSKYLLGKQKHVGELVRRTYNTARKVLKNFSAHKMYNIYISTSAILHIFIYVPGP